MRLPLVMRCRFLSDVQRNGRRRPAKRGGGLLEGRGGSLRLFGLERVEHFVRMPGYLHSAPGLADAAVWADEEGAALHTDVFAAVELLRLDHVEGFAQRLVGVADQVEAKALLVAEVLV